MRTLKTISFAALSLLIATTALAEPSAEVKAAKNVEKYEPVEAGDTFAPGSVVWVWSRVKDVEGPNVKHVWKKDGTDAWSATLKVGSKDWRTYTRRTVSAGSWVVEVTTEDGKKLGEVAFTVK
jgi:hypothetical protein